MMSYIPVSFTAIVRCSFLVYVMTLALDLSLAKDGIADCTMIMTPRFYLEIENSFMNYV